MNLLFKVAPFYESINSLELGIIEFQPVNTSPTPQPQQSVCQAADHLQHVGDPLSVQPRSVLSYSGVIIIFIKP